jgi:lipopolysaccharide export system permease protein
MLSPPYRPPAAASMPILIRHTLAEFLKVFLVTLLVATALIMIVGLLKEAVQQGLGLKEALLLIPYVLPDALRFSVPGTTLFAACSVFGRMAAANEIVAIKAVGISPLTLIWPVLAASCLVSFATLWLNDAAYSWGRNGIRRVVVESVEEIVYRMLQMHRSYGTSRFSINVLRVEDRTLIRPTFTYQPPGDKPQVTMTAAYGELRTDPDENTLTILLHNGTIEMGTELKLVFPDTREWVIPLPDAANAKTDAGGPSAVPMWRIPGEIDKQVRQIASLEQQLAAQAGYQLMTGDFDRLAAPSWTEEQHRLKEERSRLYRLRTEPHRRWAASLSCLCFVIVGAPLAVRLRNSDFLTSFFLCFLPILLVYYPLLAFGIDRAKSGAVPPQTVWLGNVMLVASGGFLMRRVLRY